jgi:acetate kinase
MAEVMFSITGLEFSFTQVMPVVPLLLSVWNDAEQKYKIYRYGYHCLFYC